MHLNNIILIHELASRIYIYIYILGTLRTIKTKIKKIGRFLEIFFKKQ